MTNPKLDKIQHQIQLLREKRMALAKAAVVGATTNNKGVRSSPRVEVMQRKLQIGSTSATLAGQRPSPPPGVPNPNTQKKGGCGCGKR